MSASLLSVVAPDLKALSRSIANCNKPAFFQIKIRGRMVNSNAKLTISSLVFSKEPCLKIPGIDHSPVLRHSCQQYNPGFPTGEEGRSTLTSINQFSPERNIHVRSKLPMERVTTGNLRYSQSESFFVHRKTPLCKIDFKKLPI